MIGLHVHVKKSLFFIQRQFLCMCERTAFLCVQRYQHALSWYGNRMCEETIAVVLSLCEFHVFIFNSFEFLTSVV